MCCGGSLLTELGIKISRLDKGTEIIILAGEGMPPVLKDTVDIIWIVADYSALTAGGIRLNCIVNSDLILTERHFDRFPVSEAAKQMSAEAEARRLEQDMLFAENEPDWSIPPAFVTEPE